LQETLYLVIAIDNAIIENIFRSVFGVNYYFLSGNTAKIVSDYTEAKQKFFQDALEVAAKIADLNSIKHIMGENYIDSLVLNEMMIKDNGDLINHLFVSLYEELEMGLGYDSSIFQSIITRIMYIDYSLTKNIFYSNLDKDADYAAKIVKDFNKAERKYILGAVEWFIITRHFEDIVNLLNAANTEVKKTLLIKSPKILTSVIKVLVSCEVYHENAFKDIMRIFLAVDKDITDKLFSNCRNNFSFGNYERMSADYQEIKKDLGLVEDLNADASVVDQPDESSFLGANGQTQQRSININESERQEKAKVIIEETPLENPLLEQRLGWIKYLPLWLQKVINKSILITQLIANFDLMATIYEIKSIGQEFNKLLIVPKSNDQDTVIYNELAIISSDDYHDIEPLYSDKANLVEISILPMDSVLMELNGHAEMAALF